MKVLGTNKSGLAKKLGISSRTIAKMSKGEKIAGHVLARIAAFLQCAPEDLYRCVCENQILQTLRDEKDAKISGGLYHELQVRTAYNSNRIEGSVLNEEQTRSIFDTRTIDAGDGLPIDDIIETSNHFRAFDEVIDHALDPLSEEEIKRIHFLLKQGTKDASLGWFQIDDYKTRPNVVGGKPTCEPSSVPEAMAELIAKYRSKKSIAIEDIIEFHADFEAIHPFQDGNGRVGRLIALKECLRNGIVPFIIEDSKKAFYYRGLAN